MITCPSLNNYNDDGALQKYLSQDSDIIFIYSIPIQKVRKSPSAKFEE